MRHIIDLTKDNFDRIDFTEASIVDFFCQRELPNDVALTIWGAVLLTSSNWNHSEKFDVSFSQDDETYISGTGMIRMNNVVGGSIEVFAYETIKDARNKTNIAKNSNGSNLVFKRNWQSLLKTVDEYVWECVIEWPHGFCNLKLFSDNGEVTYEFDNKDAISLTDYLNAPQNYCYTE